VAGVLLMPASELAGEGVRIEEEEERVGVDEPSRLPAPPAPAAADAGWRPSGGETEDDVDGQGEAGRNDDRCEQAKDSGESGMQKRRARVEEATWNEGG
jgi:hypothetical protein